MDYFFITKDVCIFNPNVIVVSIASRKDNLSNPSTPSTRSLI